MAGQPLPLATAALYRGNKERGKDHTIPSRLRILPGDTFGLLRSLLEQSVHH